MDVQMTEDNFILRNVVEERKYPSFVRSMPAKPIQSQHMWSNEQQAVFVEGRANNKLVSKNKNATSTMRLANSTKTNSTQNVSEASSVTERIVLTKLKENKGKVNLKKKESNSTVFETSTVGIRTSTNLTILNNKSVPIQNNTNGSDFDSTTEFQTTEFSTTDSSTESDMTTDTLVISTITDVSTITTDVPTTMNEANQTMPESYTMITERNTFISENNVSVPDTSSSTLMTAFDTSETETTTWSSTLSTRSETNKTTASSVTTIKEQENLKLAQQNNNSVAIEAKNKENPLSSDELETLESDLVSLPVDDTTEFVESDNTDNPYHEPPETVVMPGDQLVVNITMHSNLSIKDSNKTADIVTAQPTPLRSIAPDIEAILNITNKKDDDYEYDYNEPSLPPSLPNLRCVSLLTQYLTTLF